MAELEGTLLGQAVSYASPYDPALLDPIPRVVARNGIRLPSDAQGADLWTAFEFSCLLHSGLPAVAIVSFEFALECRNIIESKSFKLYLNSFNYKKFDSLESARQLMKQDLSHAAEGSVEVRIHSLEESLGFTAYHEGYTLLDSVPHDEQAFVYQPDPALLSLLPEGRRVEQRYVSDLLRSNCPVTGQPDWATLFIDYRGPEICAESLLRYIVSFRDCQDFHEHCVERIFTDLLAQCRCEDLSVYARYTRRGGLDINPYRATDKMSRVVPRMRTSRQ